MYIHSIDLVANLAPATVLSLFLSSLASFVFRKAMDPLSIAAGATSLVGDAGNDLERIRGELSLLESAVKCLTDDDANSMVRVPKQLNEMLGAALSACKGSVDEIIALVNNYPHRKRGRRVKWLWEGR